MSPPAKPRDPRASDKPIVIAIDGPSGAGKGTVAREVARQLGYTHIDTGAMYRAVAWKASAERIDLSNEIAVARMAAGLKLVVAGGRVTVDGRDVSDAIRTPEMDVASATVARQPQVRQVLVARQREMGKGGGIVMEGRDIGTVVFPAATVKVYLDAAPEERARRRAHDPAHAAGRGPGGVSEVATALDARDQSDRTRPTSPLTRAEDAVEIDTTGMPVEGVIERVLEIVRRKLEVGSGKGEVPDA